MLEHLLESGVAGKRIAVQLHGEPLPYFVDALREAGADVIEMPVYRWVGPADPGPLDRLLDAVLDGTWTRCRSRARRRWRRWWRWPGARAGCRGWSRRCRGRCVAACVGPITAGPLAALGVPTVQPQRARIGALARTVSEALLARSPRFCAGGLAIELRGQAAMVDGEWRDVAPAPMALLRALARRRAGWFRGAS